MRVGKLVTEEKGNSSSVSSGFRIFRVRFCHFEFVMDSVRVMSQKVLRLSTGAGPQR